MRTCSLLHGWGQHTVVVDHCHWENGEPCHIWQQSDMVIQSRGYERLGVGSPHHTDSINSSVNHFWVEGEAEPLVIVDRRTQQEHRDWPLPHAALMCLKVTWPLIQQKRRRRKYVCHLLLVAILVSLLVAVVLLYFIQVVWYLSILCQFHHYNIIQKEWSCWKTMVWYFHLLKTFDHQSPLPYLYLPTCFSFCTYQFPGEFLASLNWWVFGDQVYCMCWLVGPFAIISFLPFRG